MRIALDAMGGDFAPGPNIVGAFEAVERIPNLEVLLVGDRPDWKKKSPKSALCLRVFRL
jgi:fatty acid/phospholipid biosynthesis enzyme